MFNASMRPFRRMAEKRRQHSTIEGRNSMFAVSKTKHPKLDPEFSIDRFFLRLREFRQQQQYGSAAAVINDKPALPPKPLKKNILSTKCYIEIFKRLPAKDLLNLRLVCKEFNSIAQNHALELDTVFNDRIELAETSGNCFIRSGTNNQSSPKLSLEEIDRPLRHLQTNVLDLNGITVSPRTMRYLLRSFKYQISAIKFVECEVSITPIVLARLINPWKPKSLEFLNCTWNSVNEETETNFDQLFIDFFFTRHQNLDSLIIDFSNMPLQKLEITDKISFIFNDYKKLPSTLIFKNCLTNITAKTLHNAIWSYIETMNYERDVIFPKSFNWYFGQISDSEDTVIEILSRFNDYIVTEKRENARLEVAFQVDENLSVLNVCVDFESVQMGNAKEEENLSDIEWDESMDSDALIISTDSIVSEEAVS